MSDVTYIDYGDRIAFANLDGSHVVWKQVTSDAAGAVVGPGYVGRIIWRATDGTISGKRPCNGFVAVGVTVNDPKIQGVGIAGWHHYRDIPGETSIWNKGWDMGGNRKADPADPFGVSNCLLVVPPYLDANGNARASFLVDFVDRYSAAEGKRIAAVRYDYIVEPSDVKVWITLTEFPDGADAGPPPYVKEPKYAVGIGASSYVPETLALFDLAGGILAAYDLPNDPKLQDPTVGTEQMPWGPRTRLAFSDGADYLNVVARANDLLAYGVDGKVVNYGTRSYWAGASRGLDALAVDANGRAHFDDSVCAAYCLQGAGGTLSRKWELAKRGGDPRVEVMLHGWEGGSGLPDCLCAARAYAPGRAWTNYLSISRNAGWVV